MTACGSDRLARSVWSVAELLVTRVVLKAEGLHLSYVKVLLLSM